MANYGSITGLGFDNVQNIIYNTYQGGTYNTYPNRNNSNSIDFGFYASLIYNTITITGGFGNVVVDISQNVTRPTVSSINPSSSNTQNYATIVGTNLQNVKSILFKTKTYTQNVSVRSTDPTKIEFLVPRGINTGNLSLTGAFGLITTPVLTINYLTPQFSSFYQNGSSVSILGSNFNDVTDIRFINQFGVLEIFPAFFFEDETNNNFIRISYLRIWNSPCTYISKVKHKYFFQNFINYLFSRAKEVKKRSFLCIW